MKTLLYLLIGLPLLAAANPVVFEPQGEANGRKIVFIASDHEYRSEETCPALARILAKHHGFKTVVCFGGDDKGFIKAGAALSSV